MAVRVLLVSVTVLVLVVRVFVVCVVTVLEVVVSVSEMWVVREVSVTSLPSTMVHAWVPGPAIFTSSMSLMHADHAHARQSNAWITEQPGVDLHRSCASANVPNGGRHVV